MEEVLSYTIYTGEKKIHVSLNQIKEENCEKAE